VFSSDGLLKVSIYNLCYASFMFGFGSVVIAHIFSRLVFQTHYTTSVTSQVIEPRHIFITDGEGIESTLLQEDN